MAVFEYHEKDDIAVFENADYSDYDRSVDIANFVVDLDKDDNFLGLEVIGASERLPLSREELSEIDEVEIEAVDDENGVIVSILMIKDDEKTSLNLPISGITAQEA